MASVVAGVPAVAVVPLSSLLPVFPPVLGSCCCLRSLMFKFSLVLVSILLFLSFVLLLISLAVAAMLLLASLLFLAFLFHSISTGLSNPAFVRVPTVEGLCWKCYVSCKFFVVPTLVFLSALLSL
jgi:hypothetical protein